MTQDFLRPYGGAGGSGGSLWLKRSGDLELFYPRNANAATRLGVATGSPWTWSAYSEIVASTSEAFVPKRLHAMYALGVKADTALDHMVIEHEIATGAVSSEVPIFRTYYHAAAIMVSPGESTQVIVYASHSPPMGPDVIPSGTRLSQRIRGSNDPDDLSIVGTAIYIAGHQEGDDIEAYDGYDLMAHLAGDHDAKTYTDPSGSGVAVTASSFPNYGSWVEVEDSAPTDMALVNVVRHPTDSTGALSNYLEIGVGSAGNEVPIGRLAFVGSSFSVATNAGYAEPYRPIIALQGERIAFRATGDTTAKDYYPTWVELN